MAPMAALASRSPAAEKGGSGAAAAAAARAWRSCSHSHFCCASAAAAWEVRCPGSAGLPVGKDRRGGAEG